MSELSLDRDREVVAQTIDPGATAPPERLQRRLAPGGARLGGSLLSVAAASPAVQLFADAVSAGVHATTSVQQAAAHGLSGSSSALPHLAAIQHAFGRHDVGGVQAHVGGRAAEGAAAMGAHGYAAGNAVAFASSPDLHLAAHEAAHVVQQRAGVHLKGGVGEVGDAYERHADAVADLVVQGKSAESLLDTMAPSGASASTGVQQFAVQRDLTPATTTAATAPTTTTAPATTTGATTTPAPTTTPAAAEMVETTWTIDYDRVYRGAAAAGRAPGARTESTALHVRELVVQPDQTPVVPNTPFSGYHLRNAGNVVMGTRQHPRDQGGSASASIAYTQDRDVSLRAVGAGHGGDRIVDRVRAALSATFIPDDASAASAAATALLTDQERAARISIVARLGSAREHTVSPMPLRYGAVTGARTMNVMVEVPTGERRIVTESSSGSEAEVTAGHTAGTSVADAQETETASAERRAMVTTVQQNYRTNVEEMSRTIAEQILTRRLTFQQEVSIGGEAEAGITSNLGAEIGAGAIVALIPGIGPELAALIGDVGPSITASITPNLRLQVQATSRTTVGAEQTSETRSTDEHSVQTAVERALMNSWESTFETTLSHTIRQRHATEATAGTSGGTRTTERHAGTSRSEGTAVSQLDIPRLILRNP